ncbi:sigma-54-dependent Fis family transcriptional regulator [Pendulispora rubella]|uniref:Sigma-54-dependent Fis family transcriptional regulator n=1 Tax=Pendulispora rubella TaxID=2741070 RepID=A0ABZ2KZM0_9BACT
MEAVSTKRLIVSGGMDAGAQLLVNEQVKLVGRARDAHLMLSDRRVSRHHFHVFATKGGVHVRTCNNAAPLVHGGQEVHAAEVRIGETLLVGDTTLLVVESGALEEESAHEGATTVASLLTGAGAEIRGLAAMYALNEALTPAADAHAIEGILGSWVKQHASCTSVELLPIGDRTPERSEPLVETALADGDTRIVVPTYGASLGGIAFTLAIPASRIGDPLRRVLVLAASLCGAHLARLSVLATVKEDRETLRRQAVGSAHAFLGDSPTALELTRTIPRLAASDVTVLLLGETGVGKSFVARLLHETGPRRDAPMRIINCAAIPEALIESELFGHERGAFTGAIATKVGAFEAAGQGTILLDEIGELPWPSQAKLLRVLEEKCFERVGSNRAIPLHARVVTATNRDLAAMVAEGTFRRDLYFRVSAAKYTVPPLRDRGDDLVLLAQRILADIGPSAGRRVDGFSPDALEALRGYSWPGNVRELRHAIELAVVLGSGPLLTAADLSLAPPASVKAAAAPEEGELAPPDTVQLPAKLDDIERRAIDAALRVTGGNVTKAAALLGISRNTLHNKMRPKT